MSCLLQVPEPAKGHEPGPTCAHGRMLHPGGFALALPPRCWAAEKSPRLGTRTLDPEPSEPLEQQIPRGTQLGVGAQQTRAECVTCQGHQTLHRHRCSPHPSAPV